MKVRHKRWHLRFWLLLSVLLPGLLVAAVLLRQERPIEPIPLFETPPQTGATQ